MLVDRRPGVEGVNLPFPAMLQLLLLLLVALSPGTGAAPGHVPSHLSLIQISSFANSSWVQNEASVWLGDLQTHSWDSAESRVKFLKPWSKSNFSAEELTELEDLLRVYFVVFSPEVKYCAHLLHFEYPFVIQSSTGCGLLSGKSIERFLRTAIGGLDFLSMQNESCVPAPEGGWMAQVVCEMIVKDKDICDFIKKLLVDTCPRFLLGLLDAGKAELQRQVKPEAWLSSGPSPGPGRLLLVCHVSGFYPETLWALWVRGGQEQPGTRRGPTLPNADGTWYLQATLDVAVQEAAGLACRVRHSSLGGQDIVLHWGPPVSTSWVVWVSLVFILLSCLALWVLKRRARWTIS